MYVLAGPASQPASQPAAPHPVFVRSFPHLHSLPLDVRAQAAPLYAASLAKHPGYAEGHANYAALLVQASKLEAAADQYRQALGAKPDHAKSRKNLQLVENQIKAAAAAAAAAAVL